MPIRSVRARVVTLLAFLPLIEAVQTRASAQEPSSDAFYRKLDPKEMFNYKWQGKSATCPAGLFRWEIPESEFGTNGFDRNYTGYCAEVLVPIEAGKLYKFKAGSLYAPENFGVQEHPNADRVAARRGKQIMELFGRHYKDPLRGVDPVEAVAFQLALWEITQETEPADGPPKLDLFADDFQADYKPEDAPAFVKKAQEYLGSLTGDDSVYYTNPNTRGRELLRLKGVPNAEGVTAQAQYALRFAGGGGVGGGSSLTRALTAGSGLPASGGGSGSPASGGGPSGFFPPVGGTLGGIGPLGSTGTGGSGGGPPGTGTTTPPTTPITTTTTPPVGGPENPTPPENPPPETTPPQTTPVPAPAAFLLGGVALVTIGAWRLGARRLAAK
jgi:hypothetical protein